MKARQPWREVWGRGAVYCYDSNGERVHQLNDFGVRGFYPAHKSDGEVLWECAQRCSTDWAQKSHGYWRGFVEWIEYEENGKRVRQNKKKGPAYACD